MKTSTSARSPLSPTLWPADAFRWWASLGVVFLLAATLFVSLAVFAAAALVSGLVAPQAFQTFSPPLILAQLISYACGLTLLAYALPWLALRSLGALGLRAPRASDVAWGIGGALAMVLVSFAVGAAQETIFHLKTDEVQVHMLRDAHGALAYEIALLACVAAPFFEEVTFRGFLLNALLRYLPASPAVVLCGLLFGAAHWQPGNAGAIAPLAAGGVVLAAVYYRSGSLVASMLTHALFNSVTVVAVLVLHQT